MRERELRAGVGDWIKRAKDPGIQSRLARELERRDREGWGTPKRQRPPAPRLTEEAPLSPEDEEMQGSPSEDWSENRNLDYSRPEDHGRLF